MSTSLHTVLVHSFLAVIFRLDDVSRLLHFLVNRIVQLIKVQIDLTFVLGDFVRHGESRVAHHELIFDLFVPFSVVNVILSLSGSLGGLRR